MIKYSFENTSSAIVVNEILALEEFLSIKFPEDLKELYLRFNGGIIEGDRNIFLDEDENDYSIKYFLPIKYPRSKNDMILEKTHNIYVNEKKLVPDGYVVFAIDGGGWPYCYKLDDGNIYLANVEKYDEPENIMEHLTDSLESFINGAVTEEEAY